MNRGSWLVVGGEKQSGKDTFGEFFIERGYQRISLADNLKEMLEVVFYIPLEWFHDPARKDRPLPSPVTVMKEHIDRINRWIGKTHDFTVPYQPFVGTKLESLRRIMQVVGTDMIRQKNADYHVEMTTKRMLERPNVICCDCRFENELRILREQAAEHERNCLSVYVVRPERGLKSDRHVSETSMHPEMMDIVIRNDRDVAHLRHHACDIFQLVDELGSPDDLPAPEIVSGPTI